MKKALIYFYEIKGNSIEKAQGGIGIIPYIYDHAKAYYYNLWLIEQTNADNHIEEYQPQIIEITIKEPHRVREKRKVFVFLDEEDD